MREIAMIGDMAPKHIVVFEQPEKQKRCDWCGHNIPYDCYALLYTQHSAGCYCRDCVQHAGVGTLQAK